MPIHLDFLSRRSFFKGAAVFTASGLGLPLSAATSTDTWALLSDTHIAADPELLSRQGVNMSQNLERVVASVLKEAEHLSGVIIDGDVAYNDGQPGDYTQLMVLLKPLVDAGLPIHFTLGNHDDRDQFYEAYPDFATGSPVANKHCSVIETEWAHWILIDTLRFVNKVEGEVGEAQLKWLGDFLSQHPDKPSIVVGHHYPQVYRTDVIPSDQEIKISGIVDSEPFLDLLHQHPAAKAYIFGHSHHWNVKQDEAKLHHINLPPTAYVFDPARPNGWVRATVSPTGLKLELQALDESHPENARIQELSWR